jgi:hypothetical protein
MALLYGFVLDRQYLETKSSLGLPKGTYYIACFNFQVFGPVTHAYCVERRWQNKQ